MMIVGITAVSNIAKAELNSSNEQIWYPGYEDPENRTYSNHLEEAFGNMTAFEFTDRVAEMFGIAPINLSVICEGHFLRSCGLPSEYLKCDDYFYLNDTYNSTDEALWLRVAKGNTTFLLDTRPVVLNGSMKISNDTLNEDIVSILQEVGYEIDKNNVTATGNASSGRYTVNQKYRGHIIEFPNIDIRVIDNYRACFDFMPFYRLNVQPYLTEYGAKYFAEREIKNYTVLNHSIEGFVVLNRSLYYHVKLFIDNGIYDEPDVYHYFVNVQNAHVIKGKVIHIIGIPSEPEKDDSFIPAFTLTTTLPALLVGCAVAVTFVAKRRYY